MIKYKTAYELLIINGKVDGKVPVEDYKKIRADSVHNVDSDSLTLGKYTPTIEDAFPIGDWTSRT